MKILNVIWFTEMGSTKTIGIVLGETDHGEKKAYIGTGAGLDEYTDAKHIAQTGGKLHLSTAEEIMRHLK